MNNFDTKVYWEDRLQKSYSIDSVGYIGLGHSFNRWMYRVRKVVFRRNVKRLNLDWKTVDALDIGSGTGFYIDRWKDIGVKSVTGFDITEVAVKNLSDKHSDSTFWVVDIGEELPQEVKGSKYRVISTFDMLYHIVDDEKYKKAISNIYELLDDNGYFVLSDNFIHRATTRNVHHVNRSIDDVYEILRNVGFEVQIRRPIFYFFNEPVDVESPSSFSWRFFRLLKKMARKGELIGGILGALIYPFELLCVSLAKEGPSTEIMICKKST